jgi:hypothetical protein
MVMSRWLVALFILTGACVLSLPVFASEQREIALHIAVVDHMAFSLAAYDEVNEFIAENLPSKTLLSVKVEASVLRTEKERVHTELVDRLRDLLGEREPGAARDVITHLIIDTHGATLSDATPNDTTRLAYLGDFGTRGVDSDLTTLLEPLRGHLASNVVIVLNSCSTLCGTTAEAGERARVLLRSVGAPNAQIYGSTTPEVERPGALLGRAQWLAYLGDVGQFKLFITLGAALGVPYSVLSDIGSGHFHPAHLPIAVASVAASLYVVTALMKAALARFGNVNMGRLMVFKNGRLLRDQTVEKYEARAAVYGSCSALFL